MKRSSIGSKGFTILELISVTAIIAVLAAILLPVYRSAVLASKTQSSVQRLQQFHLAFTLYRDEWGHSGFNSLAGLAQPPADWFFGGCGGTYNFPEDYASPCGYNASFDPPGSNGVGYYYVIPFDLNVRALFSKYREKSLVVYDFQCNHAATRVADRHAKKRSLGLLFDGQIVNKYDSGDVHNWSFYTAPLN